MSKAEKNDPAIVRARVLVSSAWGDCNDIVEVEEDQAKALAGVLDTDPSAVAYAESLTKD